VNAPDTQYFQFKPVNDARAGLNSTSTVANDNGMSPITRWLSFAFDFDDLTSTAATGEFIRLDIPRGTLVMDCYVRLDAAFVGGTHNDVNIGDTNDADGYADGLDWSAMTDATIPQFFHDASAAYVADTADIVQGTSGAQYFQWGGYVEIWPNTNIATAATAGRAIVFLKTISYNENLAAEW
jgi:hypothetical protein